MLSEKEIRIQANDDTFKNQIESLKKLPNFHTIIDFGCGAGAHSKFFYDQGKTVYPIDMDLSAFQFSDLIKTYNSLEELPNEKLPVDAILISHVLEYTPNPGEFISYLLSHLKDNGILIVAVPQYAPVVVNAHYTNGWSCIQLAMFLVSQGLDCSKSFFIYLGGGGGQVFGFGIKRKIENTYFNINLSLPYLPNSIKEQVKSFPNGGEYIDTNIIYFDNEKCLTS